MRTRIQEDFRHLGLYYKKNYDTKAYATIPLRFKFKPYQGAKSTHEGNELVQGWLETDEGRTIVTKSSIVFQREDRVTIDGISYLISEILTSEDMDLELGELRNRPNRQIQLLVLG